MLKLPAKASPKEAAHLLMKVGTDTVDVYLCPTSYLDDMGVTFKKGAVEQSNYTDYEVTRMSNYPQKVAVHIIEASWGTHAGGVGEPGVPPFAPALANAVFAATGKRLRNLPMGEKLT